MIRLVPSIALCGVVTLSLAACSSGDDGSTNAVAKYEVKSSDASPALPAAQALAAAVSDAMPGKIDPPAAAWQQSPSGAIYGEPGKAPLLELACRDGMVAATRSAASDKGAKALLAFVGYRGVLRLKVENDGTAWHGALRSDDPHWKAVTGGPFYATVAGGGTVMSPASAVAAQVVTGCKVEPDAVIKGAPGEGEAVEPVAI